MGDDELVNDVVELRGVYKSIHDHEILHNINLKVFEGEFFEFTDIDEHDGRNTSVRSTRRAFKKSPTKENLDS